VQEKQYDTDDQKKVNESAGYPERQIPKQPQNNQNRRKCQQHTPPFQARPDARAGASRCGYFFEIVGQTMPWSFFVIGAMPLYRNFCTRWPR
jgi:hypothetical protein